MEIKVFNENEKLNESEKKKVVEFLHDHLDQYGDDLESITKAFDYAQKNTESFGGFIIECIDNDKIIGCSIVNKTGMSGYIPENILVYIAVDRDYRGKGAGKLIMNKISDICIGDIALHVESDNPARFLYSKIGFVKKYDEMRYIRG